VNGTTAQPPEFPLLERIYRCVQGGMCKGCTTGCVQVKRPECHFDEENRVLDFCIYYNEDGSCEHCA